MPDLVGALDEADTFDLRLPQVVEEAEHDAGRALGEDREVHALAGPCGAERIGPALPDLARAGRGRDGLRDVGALLSDEGARGGGQRNREGGKALVLHPPQPIGRRRRPKPSAAPSPAPGKRLGDDKKNPGAERRRDFQESAAVSAAQEEHGEKLFGDRKANGRRAALGYLGHPSSRPVTEVRTGCQSRGARPSGATPETRPGRRQVRGDGAGA